MKRLFQLPAISALILTLILFTLYWASGRLPAAQRETAAVTKPKYVFVFLVDGGGNDQLEITRQYNRIIHNEGLTIVDKIIKQGSLGLVTTHAANSLSTDSAAAATALAGGCKANIGAIGMCADGTVPKTVMEIAQDQGMRIGLVTNSTVYDASPAAFACHIPDRRDYARIVSRYLELGPDLVLGGGKDQFLPQKQSGGARHDDTDMISAFKKRGYSFVSNKEELERVKGLKVLGLFSLREMNFEIDRDSVTEPSVYDMTRAAIRLLHRDDSRGFFVFIETENIDSAGHLSDVASVMRDFREFDRAVALAYEFYQKYPRETLILVTSDHETGGLGFTMALKELGPARRRNQIAATEKDLRKLHSIPISLKRASEILGPHPTAASIDRLMSEYFKGFTMAPDIKEAILTRQLHSRSHYLDINANALGLMVANNTQAYWETTSHTNQPVFVAAIGPGSERFRGYQDNADFGKNLRAILQDDAIP